MKVLLIEDDPSIRDILVEALRNDGCDADIAVDGHNGLLMAQRSIYDLILLDVMLPGLDGFSVLSRLRAQDIRVPVICVTAKDAVSDRIRGLDVGADDYLVKPFSVSELLARMRALSRRTTSWEDGVLVCGRLTLRPDVADGFVAGQPVQLTPKEYALLEFLVRNQGRILTRDQILERVWGLDTEAMSSAVDVYVHYIRKKLCEKDCGVTIETKRGMGFILRAIP